MDTTPPAVDPVTAIREATPVVVPVVRTGRRGAIGQA
jgi:hypothetical protein